MHLPTHIAIQCLDLNVSPCFAQSKKYHHILHCDLFITFMYKSKRSSVLLGIFEGIE